jgi:pre-mRNA-splicing factor 38B
MLLFSHIRALGFLYLRYVCKPVHLWEWLEEYLDDEEEVQVQGGPRPVIMYVFPWNINTLIVSYS